MVHLNSFNKIALVIAMASTVLSQAIPSLEIQYRIGAEPISISDNDTYTATAPSLSPSTTQIAEPVSTDSASDGVNRLSEDAYGFWVARLSQFEEIENYAAATLDEGVATEESRKWADLGAAIQDLVGLEYGDVLPDDLNNAEKFSWLGSIIALYDAPIIDALNNAFLKWKRNGSVDPVPTLDEVIGGIPKSN